MVSKNFYSNCQGQKINIDQHLKMVTGKLNEVCDMFNKMFEVVHGFTEGLYRCFFCELF